MTGSHPTIIFSMLQYIRVTSTTTGTGNSVRYKEACKWQWPQESKGRKFNSFIHRFNYTLNDVTCHSTVDSFNIKADWYAWQCANLTVATVTKSGTFLNEHPEFIITSWLIKKSSQSEIKTPRHIIVYLGPKCHHTFNHACSTHATHLNNLWYFPR